ncbi:hypothetical protein S40293_09395 [Stachybotrys chartarum IBT 40293]|nr:hypothetical protein S40293_09395 [Stachybotrys chartarum IBT 40293]
MAPTRPPLEELDINVAPCRKRPGPKPKPLEARGIRKSVKPVSRINRTYSKNKKLDVLAFLTSHSVYDIDRDLEHRLRRGSAVSEYPYRQPTVAEASKFFNIAASTIQGWWNKKDTILQGNIPSFCPEWPELEQKLYKLFLEYRDAGKVVTTSWFRRHSKRLFAEINPHICNLFTFSNGWWINFRRRCNLVQRKITKQATRRPEEYIKFVNSFLRFIKRVSQPKINGIEIQQLLTDTSLSPTRRRFRKPRILNIDETPIPFEFLDGYTWDNKGKKTINAYNNEILFQKWIDNEFLVLTEQQDHLLVMDVAAFHKTEGILDSLQKNKITACLIPPGLTGMLQPLDTAVNKPFKKWLQDATEEYVAAREAKGLTECLIRIKDIPIEAIDLSGWKEQEEAIIKDEALVDEIEDDNQIIVAGDDEDDVYIGLLGCNVLQLKEMLREAGLPRNREVFG